MKVTITHIPHVSNIDLKEISTCLSLPQQQVVTFYPLTLTTLGMGVDHP